LPCSSQRSPTLSQGPGTRYLLSPCSDACAFGAETVSVGAVIGVLWRIFVPVHAMGFAMQGLMTSPTEPQHIKRLRIIGVMSLSRSGTACLAGIRAHKDSCLNRLKDLPLSELFSLVAGLGQISAIVLAVSFSILLGGKAHRFTLPESTTRACARSASACTPACGEP